MSDARATTEPDRDEFLRTALRHAPDRDLTPPSGLSQAILAAARQAHRPTAKPVVEPAPARTVPKRRVPWSERLQWLWTTRYAGGLATVLVGALVIGLWMNEEPPPPVAPRDRGETNPAVATEVAPAPTPRAASADAAPPLRQPATARSPTDAQSGIDSPGEREARPRAAAPAVANQKSPSVASLPAAKQTQPPPPPAATPAQRAPESLAKDDGPRAATAAAPRSEARREELQSGAAAVPAREQAPPEAARGDAGSAATARARADEADRRQAAAARSAAGADAAPATPPRSLRDLLDGPTPAAPAGAASAASPALTLWRRAGTESAARTAIWTWQPGEASSPRSFDAAGQEWLLRVVQAARGRWVDVAQATDHGAAVEARWWRNDQPVARLRIEAQGLRWLEPSGRIRYAPLDPAALERLRAF